MYYFTTATNFYGVFNAVLGGDVIKSLPVMEKPAFGFRRSFVNESNKFDLIDKGKVIYLERQGFDFMEYPLQIKFCKGNKVPDVFTLIDGYHLVSEKFKGVVESIDPEVHNFWRVSLCLDGRLIEGFYYMQVGRVLDLEDLDDSGVDTRTLNLYSERILSSDNVQGVLDGYPLFSLKGITRGFVISDAVLTTLGENDFYGFWEDGSVSEKKYGSLYRKII